MMRRLAVHAVTWFFVAGVAASCTTFDGLEAGITPSGPGSLAANPNGNDAGGTCKTGGDCKSGVCTGDVCQASTPTDAS